MLKVHPSVTFEDVELLGKGAFGAVWKVRRRVDNQIFARKEVHLWKMTLNDQQSVFAEAANMSRLRHAHIPEFHGQYFDEDAGTLHLVMEHCGGGDLGDVIKRQNKTLLPEDTIWRYFVQLVLAIDYCHHPAHTSIAAEATYTQRGPVLHRDIKPANVLLDDNGLVKLGDFGLSKELQQSSFTTTYTGTPYYMSPEVRQGYPYGTKSDIWSAGCVLYELCALRPPFSLATDNNHLTHLIVSSRKPQLPASYSEPLKDIIWSMLSPEANRRPSAQQLLGHQALSGAFDRMIQDRSHKVQAAHGDLAQRESLLACRSRQHDSHIVASQNLIARNGDELEAATMKLQAVRTQLVAQYDATKATLETQIAAREEAARSKRKRIEALQADLEKLRSAITLSQEPLLPKAHRKPVESSPARLLPVARSSAMEGVIMTATVEELPTPPAQSKPATAFPTLNSRDANAGWPLQPNRPVVLVTGSTPNSLPVELKSTDAGGSATPANEPVSRATWLRLTSPLTLESPELTPAPSSRMLHFDEGDHGAWPAKRVAPTLKSLRVSDADVLQIDHASETTVYSCKKLLGTIVAVTSVNEEERRFLKLVDQQGHVHLYNGLFAKTTKRLFASRRVVEGLTALTLGGMLEVDRLKSVFKEGMTLGLRTLCLWWSATCGEDTRCIDILVYRESGLGCCPRLETLELTVEDPTPGTRTLLPSQRLVQEFADHIRGRPVTLGDEPAMFPFLKTIVDERALIQNESAAIRTAFKEEDSYTRYHNVAKLLYIHMLGDPAHFGQIECLKLVASPRFADKRLGYLGIMLLLDEKQEVLTLVTNTLKNDMNHSNMTFSPRSQPTDSSKNVVNSILYETVLTFLDIEADSGLRVMAINILGKFLSNRDNNIRYVALNTLNKVVAIDTNAVQRHWIILDCLRDGDISIRRRALELSYALINEQNVRVLIRELLAFLEVADNEFKLGITAQISLAAERFAPNKRWHVDTVLRALTLAANYVREEILSGFIRLVAHTPELPVYTASKLYTALQADVSQESLTLAAVWLIGEYSEILMESGIVHEESPRAVSLSDILDLFGLVLNSPYVNALTRHFVLTALTNIDSRAATTAASRQRIMMMLSKYSTTPELEIQQRAIEFAALLSQAKDVVEGVLERMPPPELKATVVGTVVEIKPVGSTRADKDSLLDLTDDPVSPAVPQANAQNLLAEIFGGGGGAASGPAASAQAAVPSRQQAVNDILGLFDSTLSAPSPAPAAAAPAPAAAAVSGLSLLQAASPPPPQPAAPPAAAGYTVFDKSGLTITLTLQVSLQHPGMVAVIARFASMSGERISGLNF